MAGRWSDWQVYGTRSFPYQRFVGDDLESGMAAGQFAENPIPPTDWPDMTVQLGEQLDAARAGLGTYGPAAAPGLAGVAFSADKSNRVGLGAGAGWHASVQLGQTYISFVDPGHEDDLDMLPPLLAGLAYGVDWDYNPDSGEAVEYEGLAVRIGWDDWVTAVNVGLPPGFGQEAVHTDNDDTTYLDYNQTYYWQALPAAAAAVWQPFGVGTEVGVHVAHSSVDQPTYDEPLTLTLSLLGAAAAVHLAVQPGTLGPEGEPIADFAVAAGPASDGHTRNYVQQVLTWGIDFHRYDQTGPAVVYAQPRFRYWIPAPGEQPYLRMTQRDDGMGIRGHARLDVASDTANQATSAQHARAPRVGQSNTYV